MSCLVLFFSSRLATWSAHPVFLFLSVSWRAWVARWCPTSGFSCLFRWFFSSLGGEARSPCLAGDDDVRNASDPGQKVGLRKAKKREPLCVGLLVSRLRAPHPFKNPDGAAGSNFWFHGDTIVMWCSNGARPVARYPSALYFPLYFLYVILLP